MRSGTGDFSWREIIMLFSMLLFFTLVALYLPVFSLLVALLFPLPLALTVRRYHVRVSLWGLAVVIVAALLISGKPLFVLPLLLEAGVTGVALGLLFKNGVSPGRSFKILAAVSIFFTLGMLVLSFQVSGEYPPVAADNLMSEVDRANQWYLGSGALSEEERQMLRQQLKDFVKLLIVLIPGNMVIWAVIQSGIIYLLARRMFQRLGQKVVPLPPFDRWQYPWYVIWGGIAGLALLLAGDQWNVGILGDTGKNILYVMFFLFVFLGISVFTFFIRQWKMPKLMKVVIIFTVGIYWPIGLGLVLLLGILEPVISLRQLYLESGKGGS